MVSTDDGMIHFDIPDSVAASIQRRAERVESVLPPRMPVTGSVPHDPIVITQVKRGLITIRCPGCADFDYERTRVSVARSWANEHNDKKHSGLYKVVDLTVNLSLKGNLAT